MSDRQRDEQETLNTTEVMAWIEHLTVHADMPIDLNLVCHINRLTLRNTRQDHWGGRVRSEVDWHKPEDWAQPRAIVALDEEGLAVQCPISCERSDTEQSTQEARNGSG